MNRHRIEPAPTVPVTSAGRAVLSALVHADHPGGPIPTLTLWSPGDVTYQSWLGYWNRGQRGRIH